MRAARPDDRAESTRDAALPADHLADLVARNAKLEDDRALSLGLHDRHGVGLVDELPGQIGEELSH